MKYFKNKIFIYSLLIVYLISKNFFDASLSISAFIYNPEAPLNMIDFLVKSKLILIFIILIINLIGDLVTALIIKFMIINEFLLLDNKLEPKDIVLSYLLIVCYLLLVSEVFSQMLAVICPDDLCQL